MHVIDTIQLLYDAETTGFAGSIYADPSRALYHALGMTRETLAGTPKGVQPRSYVGGAIGNAVRSIWVRRVFLL